MDIYNLKLKRDVITVTKLERILLQEHWIELQMAKCSLIWFATCTLITCMCQANRADLGRLKFQVSRLFGKTDALQKEVDTIWETIVLHHTNIATNELGTHVEDVKAKMNETVTTVQNLTVVERRIEQYVDAKLETINAELNETRSDTAKELEHVSTVLVNLTAKQNELEEENQALKQIVLEMQTELTKLRSTSSPSTTTTTTPATPTPTPTTAANTTPLSNAFEKDWKRFNGHGYLVVPERKTWDYASKFCESRNSYLVEVATDAEAEFFIELVHDYISTDSFWFGATDRDKKGRFVYQHSKLEVPEKFWAEGQPNDYFKEEHCVMMTTHDGKFEFRDGRCEWDRYFVCEKAQATSEPSTTITTATPTNAFEEEWKSFDGHGYLLVPERKTWDVASDYCESRNSYLVEVATDAEAEFVIELARDYISTDSFWFGATDRGKKGRFVYQHSKLEVPEKFWAEGQPNDYYNEEHCVMMTAHDRKFEFRDGRCEWDRYFFCEKANTPG